MNIFHKIRDSKDPSLPYSPFLKNVIEASIPWEMSKQMQYSLSLEEKGWKVMVGWREEYIEGISVGLGVYADEDIASGLYMSLQ